MFVLERSILYLTNYILRIIIVIILMVHNGIYNGYITDI